MEPANEDFLPSCRLFSSFHLLPKRTPGLLEVEATEELEVEVDVVLEVELEVTPESSAKAGSAEPSISRAAQELTIFFIEKRGRKE